MWRLYEAIAKANNIKHVRLKLGTTGSLEICKCLYKRRLELDSDASCYHSLVCDPKTDVNLGALSLIAVG